MLQNALYSKPSLKKLINRFPKEFLVNSLTKMEEFSHIDKEALLLFNKKSKKVIAEVLTSELDEAECPYIFGLLEILCLQIKRSRKWTIYEKSSPQGDQFLHLNKFSLDKSLRKHLKNSRFETSVIVSLQGNALWCRISISDPLKMTSNPDRAFFIYYPGSRFLLITSVTKKHQDFIFECLCGTFSCESLEPLALHGEDTESLVKLAESKSSSCKALHHQSLQSALHSKDTVVNVNASLFNSRIIDDDAEMKENRYKYSKDKFGEESLPIMKKIIYETDTKFYPIENQPKGWDPSQMIKCKATLQGSNVLEGIKHFLNSGVAEAPLPPYLSNVTRLGQTVLKIQEKQS